MDSNGLSDPYCKLEFIGYPNSVKKTRYIEKTLNTFWDEFIQMEIHSISDVFQMTLYDYDLLSKDDIISTYTLDLSKLEFGITKEEEWKMIPYSSSITKPGIISVKYQITEPSQRIFESNKFEINKLTCYIHSFENIEKGKEYYCKIKTADSYKGQISNVFTDNLLMEAFNLLLRNQTETLEIILYQNEKKDGYKFSKEVKRIKHIIENMSEKDIDGVKFSLAMNDPNITFPPHPPIVNEKRYVYIYVDRWINVEKKDIKGLFVTVSLNKEEKERYSDCTCVTYQELDYNFKHTFHIPVYSLRDEKLFFKYLIMIKRQNLILLGN
jgi:hypothetical protein